MSEPPRACNGSEALCARALSEIAIAVAHNAMNVEAEGWLLPNQHLGYEDQVVDGIRGFMLDVHDDAGVATLCHGDCGLGSEPLLDALIRLRLLLEARPYDVFVLILQDEIEPPGIVDAFEASGLLPRVIGGIEPWPTLSQLIAADTRLLVTHEGARPDAPAWYHATYELAWDNDYAAASVEDFGCDVLRGDRGHEVFLLNHFLTNPLASEALAAEANPADVLLEHIERCEAEAGQRVDWIAVDFYDVGDVLSVVESLNQR
ncbi:MAG TPA: hypothetical protein ENK18_05010 [Deltaproteobacteria bacterium]|nr:hypothetical protein [Deltaproteobacteria bacterium]